MPYLDEVSSLQEILKRLKENDLPFVKQGMLYIIVIIIRLLVISFLIYIYIRFNLFDGSRLILSLIYKISLYNC